MRLLLLALTVAAMTGSSLLKIFSKLGADDLQLADYSQRPSRSLALVPAAS
jgi:hypothetical protein